VHTVREQGVGLVVSSLARLLAAVARMIEGLSGFHAATARIDNRAVFEIPELLADLLHRQQAPAPWPRFTAQPVSDLLAVAR
jgi:hypothetical protein